MERTWREEVQEGIIKINGRKRYENKRIVMYRS